MVPDFNEELQLISGLRNRALHTLTMRIDREIDRIKSLSDRRVAFVHRVKRAEDDLHHLLARVRSLAPQATLDRGYAVVQRSDGYALRKSTDVAPGDKVRIRLASGQLPANIEKE